MQAYKICISLPAEQYDFLDDYQEKHHCKTRSEVIKKALLLLQQAQLAACYEEANKEIDDDFDVTVGDGLDENETW